MSIGERLQRTIAGFKPSFWTANIMELFERIAYYGQATILSIFLRNHLKFDEIQSGQLSSIFGGLIYFLPIFAGALADRYGFKKAFSFAFLVLSAGYFLIGSTGTPAFASLYAGVDLFAVLTVILIFTAIGGSFIKPSVLGTVALTSTKETKSLGYAIYYWLVNIGGALGPLIAFFVRDSIGIYAVYFVSSLSCLLMFLTTLFVYKEPKDSSVITEKRESLARSFENLLLVLRRGRFMVFLLIFSIFWLMYWQIYVIVPFYITDYISAEAPFEIIESVGAWGIIALQLVVNRMTRKLSPINAIITGFFVSALCWGIIALHPTIPVIIAGLIVLSIGEMTQAPRYYEYIADLAPEGQEALFQGYAFLPIAIGWFLGGTSGGWLYKTVRTEFNNPELVFPLLFCLGLLASLLMWIYNIYIKKHKNV